MDCKFISRLIYQSPTSSQSTIPNLILYSTAKLKATKNLPCTTSTQIAQTQPSKVYNIKFQTLEACKLGISRYPDFEYNANGGIGAGKGEKNLARNDEELSVSFDVKSLYIPPLMSSTTKFLGFPLPPFLKIEIAPEVFQGNIYTESGKVELEFRARFSFSIGTLYRAPPLLVGTTLTSEESKGTIRSGKGKRLDQQGLCRLVGVATIDPVNDLLLDSFLGLPTECIAQLNAIISIT